jgi:pyrroloquinoline quinone biosynthesis protein B
MRVAILGSSAGGGFPQWNCACRNCRGLRGGTFPAKARTQLQVAISSDGASWFLLNASPDIGRQIEANTYLHPRNGPRESPIKGVVLTSGDLDQCLGLLLLREFQALNIYATPAIRTILREDNSMFSMLERVPDQARWNDIIPGVSFCLVSPHGEEFAIRCLPLPLPTHYPAYVSADRASGLPSNESLLGLILEGSSGGKLGYFPAVPALDEALLRQLDMLDVLLFDGTFWTDDELIRVQGHGPRANQIGHIPVSSSRGSLWLLSNLRCPRKILVHINNTNPILDESGSEYRQVRDAGWQIAEDGWQFEL